MFMNHTIDDRYEKDRFGREMGWKTSTCTLDMRLVERDLLREVLDTDSPDGVQDCRTELNMGSFMDIRLDMI